MFVELHVEQGRDLVDRRAAIGVASEIWPHGRYRFDFEGEANHAGTTRMEDRVDPMLTYAMTALAANKQARLADQRATFGRVEVTPNGTNAVPSRVLAWLDARCSSDAALEELVATVTRQAGERAERDRTSLTVTAESVSGAVSFDAGLARRIAADHEDGDWPVIPTAAGHDAGILSAAGIPTAMLFVRNPTGVSHSPDETASMPDCLAGVHALAETLERLATDDPTKRRPCSIARGSAGRSMTSYLLEARGTARSTTVVVETEAGRFVRVEPGGTAAGATRLAGLTLPGLANCHSHAFHRALRGRTQRERGTFWTWRELMYDVAGRLDPESYFLLARATYREMVAAGITGVGEFHYLHHRTDGTPYDEPERDGARPRRGSAQEAGVPARACSTRRTSPVASAGRSRGRRGGSATATPAAGRPARTARRRRHPLGARGAA